MPTYNIVGTRHAKAEGFVETLQAGEPLGLVREPTNPHDSNAIRVYSGDRHIGYIKRTEAEVLAPWMDANSGTGYSGKFMPGILPSVVVEAVAAADEIG